MELFKKKRPPYLGVSGQRRLGQIIKERKDLYADSYSLEGMRRELMKQLEGEISKKQMHFVWYAPRGGWRRAEAQVPRGEQGEGSRASSF